MSSPILLSGIKYEISHLWVNSISPGLNSVTWEFLSRHPASWGGRWNHGIRAMSPLQAGGEQIPLEHTWHMRWRSVLCSVLGSVVGWLEPSWPSTLHAALLVLFPQAWPVSPRNLGGSGVEVPSTVTLSHLFIVSFSLLQQMLAPLLRAPDQMLVPLLRAQISISLFYFPFWFSLSYFKKCVNLEKFHFQ